MTFEEFLKINNLPPVGAKLTTPNGDIVWVERYVFDDYEDRIDVRLKSNDYVINWTYEQARMCTWEEEW